MLLKNNNFCFKKIYKGLATTLGIQIHNWDSLATAMASKENGNSESLISNFCFFRNLIYRFHELLFILFMLQIRMSPNQARVIRMKKQIH